jgi:hypothetical protein
MRSRRPSSRPRRAFLLLALSAALVGVGGGIGAGVDAQEAGTVTGDTLFGSYQLDARGLGVQTRYEIEGLLPGGSPILDLTIPETVARFSSGPTGYGLASLAYPGGLIVNLGSLIAQAGSAEAGAAIPDYPIKAEAFFPSGPVTSQQNQAGATEDVHTTELGVSAAGTFPGLEADPVIKVASITSTSRSGIEEGKAVARTRVVLGGVNLLGGVITIDSLVTDLVAVHDGTTGMANGGTTATGVHFLGLAASLTKDGLALTPAPAATGPAAPLGSVLGPILDPLKGLTAPVQALVKQVLGQAVPSLSSVLAGAGIKLELLGGGKVESDSGASGYASSGLSLSFSYKGKEQTALATLINSIPPELRPSVGPLPNPIAFLTENHIGAVTLGTGTVSALASAPFDVDDLAPTDTTSDVTFPDFTNPDIGSPGFETPLPTLPGKQPTTAEPTDLTDATTAALSSALPAVALFLLLLASPFLGLASTTLADNVLAPTSTSCPSGLDKPPSPPRQA